MADRSTLLKKKIGPAGIVEKRWGTSDVWAKENPVLHEAEMGLAIAQGLVKAKLGDGTSRWAELPYIGTIASLVAGINISIDSTDPANPIISASGGGSVPTGTGYRKIVAGVEQTAASFPTKADVGLANVDDISAVNMPISAATQTALNAKLDDSQASAFGLSLLDDADAATARTTLGLGTLSTQSGTFSGTSSGTNTGDQTSIAGITGTLAEFNAALTGTDFATGGGTATGTNTGDQTLAGLGGVPTSRSISTTAPLTGGGDLAADRTFGISAATTTDPGSMSAADKTKLDGVAPGATANSSDATLLARANHTGIQDTATINVSATDRLIGRASAGAGAAEEIILTAAGRALIDDADSAAQRTTLGLVVKKLTAALSSTVTTATLITDGTTPWQHNVVAGKSYRCTVIANYQTVATTTGAKLGLGSSGGAVGTIAGSAYGAVAQAAVSTALEATLYDYAGAAGSFILTTGVSPANSPHSIGMDFIFNCTTGGTLAWYWYTEVAGSAAQINAGSILIISEL